MEKQMAPSVSEVLSPSLTSGVNGGDAYEVKFRLTSAEADAAETWTRRRLTPDPHGDDGVYRTASLYLDTPFLDIYHKSPGYRRSKYRLRRYGSQHWVHLERKIRRGDRVRKRRDRVALEEIARLVEDGETTWFASRIRQRLLRPMCWIGYTRTAFVASSANGGVRLTLDRDVRGATASAWTVPEQVDGRALLPDEVILELKFRLRLPPLFHELLAILPSRLAGVSKYGRCVEAWRLAEG